ncbi:MAG: four helix bundle protein [Gammaproteobacteria bacterium]
MDFEKLDVYKIAEKLGDEIWDLVKMWQHFERETIGKQMTRSTDSIAANIAEGAGRGSYQDNRRFVRMARASLYETRHWLRRAYKRRLINESQTEKIKPLIEEVGPRLNAYINSIGKKK